MPRALSLLVNRGRHFGLYSRSMDRSLVQGGSLALLLCLFLNWLFSTVRWDTHPTTKYPWDVGWYKSVIEQGYSFNGNYAQQQNVAFTPAYPLLCRFVKNIFGVGTPLSMHIVSSLCFFVTLALLYALLAKLFSKRFAIATTLVYATNPFTLSV